MIKVKTTADTYKSVVLRRAILICWALLFVCFVVKIFGGNYFAIMVNSPNFVQFCQYLDNNIVLYGLIGTISSLISYFFYYLAILKKLMFSKREFIIYATSVVVFCVLRVATAQYGIFNILNFLINITQCFIIPFILLKSINKKLILRVSFANVLNIVFQVIAALTKSVGIKLSTESSLVAIIFMIDLYIMLCLYYLYANNTNKKGEQQV